MFQRILVPLDGSVRAERAIPVAARLARASKGMLIFLRVVKDASDYRQATPLFQAAVRAEWEEAKQYLVGIASTHQLAGCPVSVSVQQGSVMAIIQATVETY